MDYYEHEGKALFRKYGIPTDHGILYNAHVNIDSLQYPVVLKAQVLSGHRGQAGGIRVVHSAGELLTTVGQIRSLVIGGKEVAAVLIVPALKIKREHYLGMTLDTLKKQRVLLYAAEGGVDIETLALTAPEKLVRLNITEALDCAELEKAIASCGTASKTAKEIAEIAQKLYRLFREVDGTTVEINPLAECADGRLIAADSKLVIDNSALSRHPDYTLIPRKNELTELEAEAVDAGVSYVEVDKDGTTGLIVIGAGLGISVADLARSEGVSKAAVSSSIDRALSTLKNILK